MYCLQTVKLIRESQGGRNFEDVIEFQIFKISILLYYFKLRIGNYDFNDANIKSNSLCPPLVFLNNSRQLSISQLEFI